MERTVWIFIVCLVSVIRCEFSCKNVSNCDCFAIGNDFEFQCNPKRATTTEHVEDFLDHNVGLLIHVKYERTVLDMDCSFSQLDLDLLPDNFEAVVKATEMLMLRSCHFTTRILEELFAKYHMVNVSVLEIDRSNFTVDNQVQQFRQITNLTLQNMTIDQLKRLLELFPSLISLDLIDIGLSALEEGLLEKNPLLAWLDLSRNDISTIAEGVFKPLRNLGKLHIWGNKLQAIGNRTFEGLHNLRSLELSANQINSIAPNAFKDLTNLRTVNFHKNKIETLPEGLFAHNHNLNYIKIPYNPLRNIPNYFFANMNSLEQLYLDNCNLSELPQDLFQGTVNLVQLNLAGNKLQHLPALLFAPLKKLDKLDLSKNNISSLPDELFTELSSLTTLNINDNQIETISKLLFRNLKRLNELNMARNKIRNITPGAFDGLEKMTKFNMAWNEFENSGDYRFALLPNNANLESVDLSHNAIQDVTSIVSLQIQVFLKFLDLSYNRISQINVVEFQSLSDTLEVNLSNNDITVVDFRLVEELALAQNYTPPYSKDLSQTVLELAQNPIDCDCTNYDFLRYIRGEFDPVVRLMFDVKYDGLYCVSGNSNFTFAQAPPLILSCPLAELFNYTACPDNCSCTWRPYDKAIVIDCTALQLRSIPHIELPHNPKTPYNQTLLYLDDNLITRGPNRTIRGIYNVTVLRMSHNKIQQLDWIPPQLEILNLDNNELRLLDAEVLELMNSSDLGYITLNNNPWVCDCRTLNFSNFLRQHTREIEVDKIVCNPSGIPVFNLNRKDLCHEWSIVYTILLVVSFLLVVSVTVAMYYCYQQELKVWLFAKGWLLFWVTEEEVDKDKKYDAFISFSHKDEEFVTANLVPMLETGPQPYKLCLHYRNFIPGDFISTNITNMVLDSRRTIVVLSPNFLESVWGKMEFRTAHTQAMTDGHARVIIILLGEVNVKGLDPELQSYLNTNTYVKWGDPYFWNKLRYALPHAKRMPTSSGKRNQKIANMMTFLDDKFNLVLASTPTNPNSTPPPFKLDENPLEKRFEEKKQAALESGKLIISNNNV